MPLWRTVWRFLKKLEIELPYDPEIPLLGIHTEETRIERDTCTPMFIAALFIIARTWKQPRCPSADEWIRKLWYISAFFIVQLSHPYMTTGKTIALTRQIFVGKVMSLLLNMLSRLLITFLSRSKRLLISWQQSPSAVILEPKKIKSVTVSILSPSISH